MSQTDEPLLRYTRQKMLRLSHRKLCYVGITKKSRKLLALSYTRGRQTHCSRAQSYSITESTASVTTEQYCSNKQRTQGDCSYTVLLASLILVTGTLKASVETHQGCLSVPNHIKHALTCYGCTSFIPKLN